MRSTRRRQHRNIFIDTRPRPRSCSSLRSHNSDPARSGFSQECSEANSSLRGKPRFSELRIIQDKGWGKNAPQDVTDLTSYRLNVLTTSKKVAFTLAEVLITLAIIGVVAALTIPTLVQNYQKKQWVSGLQKGYATLSNVFKMAMATDGVDSITQTSLWQALPDNLNPYFMPAGEDYSAFISELNKYLKVNKYYNPDEFTSIKYKSLDGNDWDGDFTKTGRLKIYSADGIVYYLRLSEFNEDFGELKSNWLGYIEIDVNGDKSPNQHGRDLFDIIVFDNGKLLFPGTQEWADVNGGFYHWDERGGYSCDPSVSYHAVGDYCGARIFEQGWKMDY